MLEIGITIFLVSISALILLAGFTYGKFINYKLDVMVAELRIGENKPISNQSTLEDKDKTIKTTQKGKDNINLASVLMETDKKINASYDYKQYSNKKDEN